MPGNGGQCWAVSLPLPCGHYGMWGGSLPPAVMATRPHSGAPASSSEQHRLLRGKGSPRGGGLTGGLGVGVAAVGGASLLRCLGSQTGPGEPACPCETICLCERIPSQVNTGIRTLRILYRISQKRNSVLFCSNPFQERVSTESAPPAGLWAEG